MRERQLRRWCKRELRSMGFRPPLDVRGLCTLLGDHRGRAVRLLPYRFPISGPSGLWMATATTDYIFFQRETTRAHQDHIITHEVGHILAGHHGSKPIADALEGMVPHLSPAAVRRVLQRTGYDEAQEREAELVATIIMEPAGLLGLGAPPAHRVAPALGGGPGRF
ncbi:hypothetical protein [Streptomyces sp. NPDC046887]|uniref:hypothetical protein n=1 Tax=Streptomyces sp. NPDC046887 TaxID=3155472 RepID=UPI0033F7D14B